MTDLSHLTTPSFLAAMPHVDDPFFHRSLVLILDHDDEDGTFGLIVNRPTGLEVREVLDGLEMKWRGNDEPTFFGGPVQPQRGSILFRDEHPERLSEQVIEIGGGLMLTQSSTDLAVLANQPPSQFRLILGCAGWGPGQLADEIGRHDWALLPCETDLVFATSGIDPWHSALLRAGIAPDAISPPQVDGQPLTN